MCGCDPFQAQRWHVGNEPFGRQWQSGDVVGCMIDLTEMNIMFTLNGEMLISDSGSEMAFKDIEIGEGKNHVGRDLSVGYVSTYLTVVLPTRFYPSVRPGSVSGWEN